MEVPSTRSGTSSTHAEGGVRCDASSGWQRVDRPPLAACRFGESPARASKPHSGRGRRATPERSGNWSRSKMSRVDNREHNLNPREVGQVLAGYVVSDTDMRDQLVELATKSRKKPTPRFATADGPPDEPGDGNGRLA